ncbi:MAG: hypothetical protein DDT19_01268 [Syntrophomonadaceae bacterium]|nr:hypothetical protein [Bacillota bacterium]
MNLFQNPFYIIRVSTRDSKQTIVETCDAKSLTIDADLCTRFRSVLTHPRNRLSAELAWLPGLSPVRALGLIEKLENDPKSFLASLYGTVVSTELGEIVICHSCGTRNKVPENRLLFEPKCGKCKTPLQTSLNPLGMCNVLITYLFHHKPQDEPQISNLLIDIARSFDQIDYSNLLTIINEDRQIAKIPLIQDTDSIKQEMQNRRDYMIGVMKNSLNNTKAPDKVLTEIVAKTMSDGKQHPPVLVEELTDKYQVEVQKYLDQLVGKIRNIMSSIQKQPKKTFEYQMPTLYKYLKTWDQIAQPIQLIQQSKGIDDPHSKELAQDLRVLAINMANSYEMHPEAKQITKMVAEIFKELPRFAEKVSEDLTALEDVLKHKAKSKEEERKWRNERVIDIEIGKIFKKRLIITPEFISYNGEKIITDEVTRVRWGVFVQVINGIRRSYYTIWIGTPAQIFEIECNTTFDSSTTVEKRYEMILAKLWKAVCIRLVGETLNRLSSGEKLAYDDIVVDKNGILLRKRKFLGSDPFYSKWEELSISNAAGAFVIQATKEKKASATLYYRNIDNVHILETVMRFLWKDGNYQKLRSGEFSESSEKMEENIEEHDDDTDEPIEDGITGNASDKLIEIRCPICKEVMTVSLQFTPRGSIITCSNCSREFILPH